MNKQLEVVVVSKEIIKPTCPTSHHLCHYQLSFLDQLSPTVYNPLILLYPKNQGDLDKFTNQEISDKLKQSLSEALTYFYPLAGRIQGNDFVDCSDEGIPYVEAHVKCYLSEVIKSPVPEELRKLLPFGLADVQEVPLGVQLNMFACGGLAITFCLSHKLGDALSTISFLKTWAAICRGETNITPPDLTSATLFPPKDLRGYDPTIGVFNENVVTKRFVFPTSSIEAIRARYAPSPSLKNERPPSRIEALSCFIWARFMSSTVSGRGLAIMIHAVNVRPRLIPPLPEHAFGNYYRIAITFTSEEGDNEGFAIVRQLRESIRSIDNEYMRELTEGDDYMDFLNQQASNFNNGQLFSLNFTSLCRFPQYDADFGWGKPLWVGAPSLTFKDLVVFMDTATGDGIEALVHLGKEDMARFQEDKELLLFADVPQAS